MKGYVVYYNAKTEEEVVKAWNDQYEPGKKLRADILDEIDSFQTKKSAIEAQKMAGQGVIIEEEFDDDLFKQIPK